MVIPLSKPYVDDEIKNAVMRVLDSGQYILGNECKAFEKEFASYIGTKHAILTSSGTAALFLCLKALDIGSGDGVLVPSLTAFPTIEAIFHTGARPIFVDIDDTFTINPKHAQVFLENRKTFHVKIKGIIPVHLYGHPANMDEILSLATKYELHVIEDCCQAHGAMYKEWTVGSMGIAGCFSFYPSKNLTVLGDGGMITTSDDDLSKKCRILRNHGRKAKYKHELVGYNLRFNEIQAAVGRIQLRNLDKSNKARRNIARWYNVALGGNPIILPQIRQWAESVYHLYVIQADHRDRLADYLREKGIKTGIHYPIPCHLQPATVKTLGPQPSLSRTEEVVKTILSLPMYPELERDKVEFVCAMVREFFMRL